jgi:uncharacterized protein YggE
MLDDRQVLAGAVSMANRATILLACAALSAGCCFCQVDAGSVTVTATRAISAQPDQTTIAVVANTPATANLDDALALLSGLGIGAGNLSYVNTTFSNPNSAPQLQWGFQITVPLANLNATIQALAKVTANTGGNVSYSVVSTQASAQATAQQCPLSDLLSDARQQAQMVAAPAGRSVGPVLALASTPVPAAVSGITGSFLSARVVAFSDFLLYSPPATCSITVKFAFLP